MSNNIQIVISAVDKATAGIKGVGKELEGFAERNRKTFAKMAAIGTTAFAGLTYGINKATQAAAADEGTWNKFATVFSEGTEEMNTFVNDLRTRMPVATGTIQRMAADLQDLLVPIGLSRELGAEMTQGFLEVANAVGAFNDVDPSEVLEAIKSGLTGNSQSLKRFGVDASVTALEVRALEMGLLEAGQKLTDLEPAVQNQIKAQALLAQVTAQSSDAIGGFEANSDSLIFRQMELKATMEDLTGQLGTLFLPIIDSVVKAVIPLITSVAEWTKENEDLTKKIILGTTAISGIIAVLGTLGLAIIPIKIAITSLGTVLVAFTGIVKGVGVALAFLAANPIGALIVAIGAIIAVIALWVKNWEELSMTISYLSGVIKGNIMSNFAQAKDGASLLWQDMWEAIQGIMMKAVDWLTDKFQALKEFIQGIFDFANQMYDRVTAIGRSASDAVSGIGDRVSGAVSGIGDRVSGAVSGVANRVTGARALGGPVQGGRSYLVGERGPELFTPGSSGLINPNPTGGGTININMGGVVVQKEADENRLVDKMKMMLTREAKNFNIGIV